MKLDNIHYNLNKILSYNKVWNFVLSARDAGKSTAAWLYVYKRFKKYEQPVLVIRRKIADITDAYVEDIAEVINNFLEEGEEPIKFKTRGGGQGVVDVFMDGKLFIRVIALSNPKARIKSLVLRDVAWLIFDEYIVDTNDGEKYLPNEIFKFKELYKTFRRYSPNGILRCLFLGNPYSRYSPYFSQLISVDTRKLDPGTFTVGEDYVVECYQLSQELIKILKEKDPLWKDDAYSRYAFTGQSINDEYTKVMPKLPQGFELHAVFYLEQTKLCVYRNNSNTEVPDFYWVGINNDYQSTRRDIMTFDYSNLIEGTMLASKSDCRRFNLLVNAFRYRKISFQSLEASYLFGIIYQNIL